MSVRKWLNDIGSWPEAQSDLSKIRLQEKHLKNFTKKQAKKNEGKRQPNP